MSIPKRGTPDYDRLTEKVVAFFGLDVHEAEAMAQFDNEGESEEEDD